MEKDINKTLKRTVLTREWCVICWSKYTTLIIEQTLSYTKTDPIQVLYFLVIWTIFKLFFVLLILIFLIFFLTKLKVSKRLYWLTWNIKMKVNWITGILQFTDSKIQDQKLCVRHSKWENKQILKTELCIPFYLFVHAFVYYYNMCSHSFWQNFVFPFLFFFLTRTVINHPFTKIPVLHD